MLFCEKELNDTFFSLLLFHSKSCMNEAKEVPGPAVVCVGASETVEQSQRKRKSRWGGNDAAEDSAAAVAPTPSAAGASLPNRESEGDLGAESKEGVDGAPKPRKSRFTVSDTVPAIPTAPLSQEAIQQSLVLQMQLRQITDRLPTIAIEAAAIEANPNRSPSPPPRYDSNGKRTNTREMRMREALTQERITIIEKLLKLNPLYQVRLHIEYLINTLCHVLLSHRLSHLPILFDRSLCVDYIFR